MGLRQSDREAFKRRMKQPKQKSMRRLIALWDQRRLTLEEEKLVEEYQEQMGLNMDRIIDMGMDRMATRMEGEWTTWQSPRRDWIRIEMPFGPEQIEQALDDELLIQSNTKEGA